MSEHTSFLVAIIFLVRVSSVLLASRRRLEIEFIIVKFLLPIAAIGDCLIRPLWAPLYRRRNFDAQINSHVAFGTVRYKRTDGYCTRLLPPGSVSIGFQPVTGAVAGVVLGLQFFFQLYQNHRDSTVRAF